MARYQALIGDEEEIFKANSLKEAKKFADQFKRRNGLKGRTTVRLIRETKIGMTKKADNIFVRAKAYVKEHPRTSFQDAIQKVKGKKVSGVKAKPKIKTAARPAASRKPARVAKVAGTRKRVAAKPAGGSSVTGKKAELLSAYMRIDNYEQLLRAEKRVTVKRELINKINNLHDKVDRLKAAFVQ